MAEESSADDYPHEIDEQLQSFNTSMNDVKTMVDKLVSISRNDQLAKLDPLDQAKVDLMSAYSLTSLFWMYLITQGINPREHEVKTELERIRNFMNRVKEITDKKNAARLDKEAVSRFVRNALYDAKDSGTKAEHKKMSESPKPKRSKLS